MSDLHAKTHLADQVPKALVVGPPDFSADLDWIRLPLANNPSFSSSDVSEVREYMGNTFCPHDLLLSKDTPSIDFRHYSAKLRAITFNVIDYGAHRGTVTVNTPDIGDHYLAQFSLRGRCELSQGADSIDLAAGRLFIFDPNGPLSVRLDAGYVHLMIRIERDALQQALARELGFVANEPVLFDKIVLPPDGSLASLMRMILLVCEDLDTTSPGMAHKRVAPHIEEALLSLLLNTVPHNYSSFLEQSTSSPSPYYIRRAASYIEAHAREPITLGDLVAASGVSARSLHAGFRSYKQSTPMGYLRAYRLDLAKRDLQTAERRGLSVTDVALGCGFNHLSKFAREYRLRFGVSPSHTRSGR